MKREGVSDEPIFLRFMMAGLMGLAARCSSSSSSAGTTAASPPSQHLHTVLIDGTSVVYRAFHAIPPMHRPSDGAPVNALYGLVRSQSLQNMSLASLFETIPHLSLSR